ncbi:MAG TPA: hypothetical protein ENK85_08045 [Saprospiraceae bacterium]|nr:hypothetical protein [Saprospiraceae bacterium]
MKKNLIIGLFAFVSIFMFSGCIDFLEDITYHRNGSGSYKFTVDMGAVKSLLDSFGDDEEKKKEKDPMADMNKTFSELEKNLEKVPGISHFKSIEDTAAYVFGFSFDFKNADALDKALHEQNDKLSASTKLFSGGKRIFSRFNAGSLAEAMKDELAGDDSNDEDMEMVKSMFGDMKLRTVYHFDRKVKSSSNPNSQISADYKQVTLDYYFFKPELNKGDQGVGTVIKLKRR